MTTHIDVVCPVYREEATISAFHHTLQEATASITTGISFRYIYVVDPSRDRTEEILRDLAARDHRVSVIVMSRRFGHQAALVAGLDASTGDAVVMLDSDLQHPPSLIPELVRHWDEGADIVQAVRHDGAETKFERRLTSDVFYKLFDQLTDMQIGSGAADYRLLSRRVVDVFRHQLREHNPFVRGLVTWVGYEVAHVPFTPSARTGGKSKYSVSTLLAFAANGLCSFSKVPLRLCIWLGFGFAVLSIIGGLLNVVIYVLQSDNYAPGWASLFAFLTFAFGVMLFFLGILGEYIGLIFDEVKGRPRYLVRNTYGGTAVHACDGRGEQGGEEDRTCAEPPG